MNDDALDALIRDGYRNQHASDPLVASLRPRASRPNRWLMGGALFLAAAATFGLVLMPPATQTPELPIEAAAGFHSDDADEPPDQQELSDLMQQRLPEVEDCYNLALGEDPTLSGKVVVGWQLSDGQAEQVWIQEDELGHEGFNGCLLDQVASWEFADFSGKLMWPFVLRPGAQPAETVEVALDVVDVTHLNDRIGIRDIEGLHPIPDGLQVDTDILAAPVLVMNWGQEGLVEIGGDPGVRVEVEVEPAGGSDGLFEIELSIGDGPVMEAQTEVWPGHQQFALIYEHGEQVYLLTAHIDAWDADQ